MNNLHAKTALLLVTSIAAVVALITIATMYTFKVSKKDGVDRLAIWASRPASAGQVTGGATCNRPDDEKRTQMLCAATAPNHR